MLDICSLIKIVQRLSPHEEGKRVGMADGWWRDRGWVHSLDTTPPEVSDRSYQRDGE